MQASVLETADGLQNDFWIVIPKSKEEIIIDNGYDIQVISNTEMEYLDYAKEIMESLDKNERNDSKSKPSKGLRILEYNPHIFDGIFKLDYERCSRLFIPVVNELFGLNISENAEIRRESTEIHYQDKDKIIRRRNLDSLFRIGGELYHIECESKNDADIILRIVDYDMAIVIGNAFDNFNNNRQVLLELPKSAVIFVRDFPEENYGTINYKYPSNDGVISLDYDIPFLKLTKYNISELEESKLYVLYPLYIAKYENELKSLSYNSKEEDILSVEKVLAEMYNSLNNAELEGIIEHHEYIGLLQSSHQIINYYVKIPEIAERLVNVMGGVETRTCEQIGEDRKAIEMIKNLMQTTKESFEQVCQLLNVKTEDMVRYKKMI